MVRRSVLTVVIGGLAAGPLAFGSGVAGASVPATARVATHRYTFILDIKKGNYASDQTVDGYSQHEVDNFGGQSFVGGVLIPVKPKAFTILKPATRFSMWPDEHGTPEWRTYGSGGLNCKAHLTNNDPDIPPPILKGYAAKGSTDSLTFKIQLGASIIVLGATGHHPSAPCNSVFPDGAKAFTPAEKKYMPEMVTAKLTVSLKKIRALAAGKEIVIDVTAHKDALELPPQNCSFSGLTCTQSTTWTGTLTIRRIE